MPRGIANSSNPRYRQHFVFVAIIRIFAFVSNFIELLQKVKMKKLIIIAIMAVMFAGCEKEPAPELRKITIYSFNVYSDSYADIMGYELVVNGVKTTHSCRGEYTTHYQSLDEPIYIYGKSFANHPTPIIYLTVFVDDVGAFSIEGNPINYNGPIYFEN